MRTVATSITFLPDFFSKKNCEYWEPLLLLQLVLLSLLLAKLSTTNKVCLDQKRPHISFMTLPIHFYVVINSEVSLFCTLCFQIVYLTSGCTGDMSLSPNYVSIFHVYLLIWGLANLTKRETRILDKHLNTTMLRPLAFLLLVSFSSGSPVTKVKISMPFIFALTHILLYPAI